MGHKKEKVVNEEKDGKRIRRRVIRRINRKLNQGKQLSETLQKAWKKFEERHK